MELKEGRYVRTKDGFLSKIEFLNSNAIYIEDSDLPLKEEQIKASYNIIDLIEVGDYVNGFPVRFAFNCDEDSTGLFIDTNSERVFLDKPSQVKSIVTKEQFESICYKVEEQ